jgi:hypothetical protein
MTKRSAFGRSNRAAATSSAACLPVPLLERLAACLERGYGAPSATESQCVMTHA